MQKKPFFLLLKISLSIVLILWITQGVALDSVFAVITESSASLLILAFSLFFVGYVIAAFRWRTLIRVQDGDAPIFFLVRSFMVALFFNNFLPSTVGGDVVRMYDSWRLGNTKSDAVTVVLVDRFLGVIVLFCFALLALVFDETVASEVPFITAWVAAGLAGMGIATWLVLTIPVSITQRLSSAKSGVMARIGGILEKVHRSFQAYRQARSAVLRALGLSVLLQVNVVVHFILVARAVGIDIPAESMFLIIPVAVFVMMVPISINAIGVREAVFVFLLSLYGVQSVEALAFAWIAYSFTLLQGVLGGLVFALRREKRIA
ncbi:MAG: hypothetical protein CL401_02710 [Acidiferrobacteraceae bacterium]|nr:hypothetical protein [Acidiferrobacteraceae bacterium]